MIRTQEYHIYCPSKHIYTSLLRTPRVYTPRYYGQQLNPRRNYIRLTEVNSRYYGLSLLRTTDNLFGPNVAILLFSLSL